VTNTPTRTNTPTNTATVTNTPASHASVRPRLPPPTRRRCPAPRLTRRR
jgi:hypothetical protein